MRISCKKLAVILKKFGIKLSESELKGRCEAYGRNVRCYVSAKSLEGRKKLEAFLKAEKVMFSRSYWPGSHTVEIGVTYFKAWHWDE